MRRKVIASLVVILAFAVAETGFAEDTTVAEKKNRLDFEVTPGLNNFPRLAGAADYLCDLGIVDVGGGLCVDYGLSTSDLWLCPYARLDLWKSAYLKAGAAFLVSPTMDDGVTSYTYDGSTYNTSWGTIFASIGAQFALFKVGPGKIGVDIHFTLSLRPYSNDLLAALGTIGYLAAGIAYRL